MEKIRFLMTAFIAVFLFSTDAIAADRKAVVTGKASWYSKNDKTDPFEHLLNADQTPFDENALTCAMRSRRFGKRYKVTNVANGKSVVVVHRDFGPARKYKGRLLNRVVDLSKAAFTCIGDPALGVIRVRVEPL
jgi:rare lipoprotein A